MSVVSGGARGYAAGAGYRQAVAATFGVARYWRFYSDTMARLAVAVITGGWLSMSWLRCGIMRCRAPVPGCGHLGHQATGVTRSAKAGVGLTGGVAIYASRA